MKFSQWWGFLTVFSWMRSVCSFEMLVDCSVVTHETIIIIIIISNLSNDRSKASSKTIPPHSAI